ncbi:nuclease SbcCD subunit C [Hydra vulgaris]|uniref:nuclease SbcCD subunit C n=1 Tax=Hydra vulgaris TaxID=6087 RepID=UPI0001925E5E|nr:nuclease SbcCD subunit C [Hydra vulgaris]
MNQKKVFPHTDNVFWKKENFTMHNVMLDLPNPEPKKLINSTPIKAEKKHLKSKFITKIESSKPIVQVSSTELSKPLVQISSTNISSELNKKECTLKDLCKEDKIKITNLIKELAKYGEEKEKALEELQNMKKDFEEKLQILDKEKQISIRDQIVLKEKLLEYEFSKKNEINLEEKNNAKHTSFCESDISEMSNIKNDLENVQMNIVHKRINVMLPDENTLADIFHEQQKQFELQQKRLQDQIEQLQKLQESVVVHQINTKARIQSISPIFRKETEDRPLKCATGLDLTLKEYPIVRKNKLDEYLISQNKINNLISDSMIKMHEKIKGHYVPNDSQTNYFNKNSEASSLISASTSPVKDKKEISIQTDIPIENTSLKLKDSTKVNLLNSEAFFRNLKYQENYLSCTMSQKKVFPKKRQSNSHNVLKLVGISSDSDEDNISDNPLKNSYTNKKNNFTFQKSTFQPNHYASSSALVDCFSSKNVQTCALSKNLYSGKSFSTHSSFEENKLKEEIIDDCKILNDIFFIC